MTPTSLAKLQQMQARANDGQGIPVIKTILAHLHQEDYNDAYKLFRANYEELKDYPQIHFFLRRNLRPTLNLPLARLASQLTALIDQHELRDEEGKITCSGVDNGDVAAFCFENVETEGFTQMAKKLLVIRRGITNPNNDKDEDTYNLGFNSYKE